MNTDIRLKVSFLNHRKRKKLQRALGADGVLAFIDLMLSAATSRPDGIFTGYDREDITIDAQWDGDVDKFVDTLISVGLLDVLECGTLAIHDWQDHNGYASDAEVRSGEGRFGNLKKYYPHRAKELEAKGITTISAAEYAIIKAEESGASRASVGGESGASRGDVVPDRSPSPPSPSPSPSPSPAHAQDARARVDQIPVQEKKSPLPPGPAIPEYSIEFLQLVELYPRKEGIEDAWVAFKGLKAAHAYPGNPIVLPVLAQWAKSERWAEDGGKFVPSLKKWLHGKRWQDDPPKARAPASPPPGQQAEAMTRSAAAVISKLSDAKRKATPMPENLKRRFASGAENES
jgi:hypothetical protein